jgi:aryl-alcohol dehydrogenase-like predicted oxidoreductase
MNYKLLGRSGLRVCELCLGTMTFGEEGAVGSSLAESKNVFDTYVEAGGNFFDTANIYAEGRSEKLLGKYIGTRRERAVIATKYTLSMNPSDPNAAGSHRKNLFQSVHASLQRLNTDYIDLLWVHAWDHFTPIEELMRALDDLVSQGKILYIGASNFPSWVVARANTMAEERGWTPFVALQLEYSLLERTIEREYFDLAPSLGLSICAWSPLGGGVLTGKYTRPTQKVRYREKGFWTSRYVNERTVDIGEEVVAVAKEIGRTPAQVALNWLRQKQSFLIPIIGAKRASQLKDSLGCLSFSLTEEHMKRLDAANPLSLGFPREFLVCEGMRRLIYGDISTF